MNPKKDIWFPQKRYGWGWGFPFKWQGWAVLAVFIALILSGAGVARIPRDYPPTRRFWIWLISSALSSNWVAYV